MRTVGVAAALAGAALFLSACTTSEVALIAPKRPSRGDGCGVQVFLTAAPPYPVVELATARAGCDALAGRHACIEALMRDACHVGADTLFGFSETVRGDYTYLSATLAAQDAAVTHRPIQDAPAPKAGGAAVAADGGGGCDPICSPGFACRGGACVPQCNPPCEAGEICNRKRVCEAGK